MGIRRVKYVINSILGGIAPFEYAAGDDQFLDAYSISPDVFSTNSFQAPNGVLQPIAIEKKFGIANTPMWMVSNPKDELRYIYDSAGSVYTMTTAEAVNNLGDLNDGGSASGNGAAYYDNYIYFARDTTIARYGPLNGTPSFTDDYWVGILGKAALIDTTYPDGGYSGNGKERPNHILHRHSDGKLYIADVVDNRGTLHYIQTTKTTVEGDTDNGSTYSKIALPFGYYITAIESYGELLAIAIYEGSGSQSVRQGRAKLGLWDTTSSNFNSITWREFPDPIIGALLNTNGILYVFSGGIRTTGVRITRYVGGGSFEQVVYYPHSICPFPDAVDGSLNKVFFGGKGNSGISGGNAGIYSIGLDQLPISNALFGVGSIGGSYDYVTTLKVNENLPLTDVYPIFGASNVSTPNDTSQHGIFGRSNTYSENVSIAEWRSRFFNIGKPYTIRRIYMPTVYGIGSSTAMNIGIVHDNFSQTSFAFNSASPILKNRGYNIDYKPSTSDAKGNNRFYINILWDGDVESGALGIPIEIDVDIHEED